MERIYAEITQWFRYFHPSDGIFFVACADSSLLCIEVFLTLFMLEFDSALIGSMFCDSVTFVVKRNK